MKEYFSHDYNASNDPKIMALLYQHGAAGYGIWWFIIEMLHNAKNHILPMQDYLYKAIASRMKVSPKVIENFIKNCISEFKDENGEGLFYIQRENMFASRRVDTNINIRSELSHIRSNSGKRAHIKKVKSTQELTPNDESIIIPFRNDENDINSQVFNNAHSQYSTANAEQMPGNCQENAQQNASKEKKLKKIEEKDIIEIKRYEDVALLCKNMNIELQNAVKEHIENRVLKNKPFTTTGFNRFLKKLFELSGDDQNSAINIIQQSVDNRWNDIFQLKDNNNGSISYNKTGKNSKAISNGFKRRNDEILNGG